MATSVVEPPKSRAVRALKHPTLEDVELTVHELTSSHPQAPGPDRETLTWLCLATANEHKYKKMMSAIWRRMSHAADQVHVMKAMNLLHWLLTLRPPSAAVQIAMVQDCNARREQFRALAQLPVAANSPPNAPHAVIRQRAKDILDFLDHFSRLSASALGTRAYTASSIANVDKLASSNPVPRASISAPAGLTTAAVTAATATAPASSTGTMPATITSTSVLPHPPAGLPPNPLDNLLAMFELGSPPQGNGASPAPGSNGHNGHGHMNGFALANRASITNGPPTAIPTTSSTPPVATAVPPPVDVPVKKLDPRTLKSPGGGKSRARPPRSPPSKTAAPHPVLLPAAAATTVIASSNPTVTVTSPPPPSSSLSTSSSSGSTSSSNNSPNAPPVRPLNISSSNGVGSNGAPGTGISPGGLSPATMSVTDPSLWNRRTSISPTPFDMAAAQALQFPATIARASSMPNGTDLLRTPSIPRSTSSQEHVGDPFAHLGGSVHSSPLHPSTLGPLTVAMPPTLTILTNAAPTLSRPSSAQASPIPPSSSSSASVGTTPSPIPGASAPAIGWRTNGAHGGASITHGSGRACARCRFFNAASATHCVVCFTQLTGAVHGHAPVNGVQVLPTSHPLAQVQQELGFGSLFERSALAFAQDFIRARSHLTLSPSASPPGSPSPSPPASPKKFVSSSRSSTPSPLRDHHHPHAQPSSHGTATSHRRTASHQVGDTIGSPTPPSFAAQTTHNLPTTSGSSSHSNTLHPTPMVQRATSLIVPSSSFSSPIHTTTNGDSKEPARSPSIEQLRATKSPSASPADKPADEAPPTPNTVARREKEVKESEVMMRRRVKLVEEILDTERNYVSSLATIMVHFRRPLLDPSIRDHLKIKEDMVRAVFSNLPSIYAFHSVLLAELSRSNANLPKTFAQYADYLKMYSAYLNGYEHAIAALNNARHNTSLQAFLANPSCHPPPPLPSTATSPSGSLPGEDGPPTAPPPNLTLLSYLIMPVQRIPRYVLLLKELQRLTPAGHADIPAIQSALTKVESIAKHVNEQKRVVEDMSRLIDIQGRLKGAPENFSVLKPHRRLLHDGMLRRTSGISPAEVAHATVCRVFLFTDIVLWTADSQLKFGGVVELTRLADIDIDQPLPGFAIHLCLNAEPPVGEPGEGEASGLSQLPCLLVCKDEKETIMWSHAFADAIRKSRDTLVKRVLRRSSMHSKTVSSIH